MRHLSDTTPSGSDAAIDGAVLGLLALGAVILGILLLAALGG